MAALRGFTLCGVQRMCKKWKVSPMQIGRGSLSDGALGKAKRQITHLILVFCGGVMDQGRIRHCCGEVEARNSSGERESKKSPSLATQQKKNGQRRKISGSIFEVGPVRALGLGWHPRGPKSGMCLSGSSLWLCPWCGLTLLLLSWKETRVRGEGGGAQWWHNNRPFWR